MFKFEWIFDIVSVESVIVHAADYDPRREVTGKQLLVITFQVACRDSVGLAYDSLEWYLANPDSRALALARKTDGLSCTLWTNTTVLMSLTV